MPTFSPTEPTGGRPVVQVVDPASVRRSTIAAYVQLMKPRIIELLLITTVPAMILAADGWPGTWLVLATLIGGTLAAGGANAINNAIDADIDAVMRRTRRRPTARAEIGPRASLVFGMIVLFLGFLWLWTTTNLLAAALAYGAGLFYVFVYSLYLKRRSPQNIVIGGAAGAAPALVGWAAVRGELDLPAWILFAIVFYWTPPHFWALALRYADDYAAAGVPMLPVVAGPDRTTRAMVRYTVVLVVLSLALAPVAGLGAVYLVTAVVLGAWFLAEVIRVRRDPGRAMAAFRVSTIYLAVLFAAVAADVLIR